MIKMPGATSIISDLEKLYSTPFVGISFQQVEDLPKGDLRPLRFCEHLKKVMDDGIDRDITASELDCLGCKWAFGLIEPNDGNLRKFTSNLIREGRFDVKEQAMAEVLSAPTLEKDTNNIHLSRNDENPDVLISYLYPGDCMNLIATYQKVTGNRPILDSKGIMPVCGQCSVSPVKYGKMTLSLGCRDSRLHGGIPRDRMVVGIPYDIAVKIVERLRE